MMTTDESELWGRISLFEFDRPDIKLTFAKRLARENNISESFAKTIIDEYKKFIFLCCVSKNQVTPSHYVDLAWHLHLTYTKSYWVDLCQKTLQREIHHNPTEGGNAEDKKFEDYYGKTLKQYESYFVTIPPVDIWPTSDERFKVRAITIDKNKNWIIPKPNSLRIQSSLYLFFTGIFISILLIGCSEDNYVGVSIFVIVVLALVGWFIYSLRKRKSNKETSSGDSSGCSMIDHHPSSHSHSHHGSGDHSGDDGGDSGGGDSGCSSGCGGGD